LNIFKHNQYKKEGNLHAAVLGSKMTRNTTSSLRPIVTNLCPLQTSSPVLFLQLLKCD